MNLDILKEIKQINPLTQFAFLSSGLFLLYLIVKFPYAVPGITLDDSSTVMPHMWPQIESISPIVLGVLASSFVLGMQWIFFIAGNIWDWLKSIISSWRLWSDYKVFSPEEKELVATFARFNQRTLYRAGNDPACQSLLEKGLLTRTMILKSEGEPRVGYTCTNVLWNWINGAAFVKSATAAPNSFLSYTPDNHVDCTYDKITINSDAYSNEPNPRNFADISVTCETERIEPDMVGIVIFLDSNKKTPVRSLVLRLVSSHARPNRLHFRAEKVSVPEKYWSTAFVLIQI
ncbi:MAG: hypothetical protein H7A35_07610 [Planctomycetales bacterium]|nr:hypothetical protein [bacterium]UNM09918.1 MAG: hypothetical protein H7A35_07610 [Planctomycetales bacterium]